MKLGPLLRAHAYLRLQHPPELWEIEAQDVAVIRLLGEMIAAALSRGTPLAEVVLNVSNVTVEMNEDEAELAQQPPPGDFVALTISGGGDWRPEIRWWPEQVRPSPLVSDDLDLAARAAGVRFGYTHATGGTGSVTVFLLRRVRW